MNGEKYLDIKEQLINAGYAHEIAWAQNIGPCGDARDFFMEYAWVVINSGMKEQIARKIWNRIQDAFDDGDTAADVFGHRGKANAIDLMWSQREKTFMEYQQAPDKLAFLRSLPWIGEITKFHLAKNLGIDCAKPDRHLARIARTYGKTSEDLCLELAAATGDHIAVVDTVLWRAANLGML